MNDFKYTPSSEYRFFYHDPGDDGFVYFRTKEERDVMAQSAIDEYLNDGWSEDVEGVTVGEVTGMSTKVDVVKKPVSLDEENCDENGEWWDSDWDYKCNYRIKPITSMAAISKCTLD